ncbi:Holliday junction resolvase RecU [Halalkalibacterium ligniniphilum]|uniref:Holliday junction resolvase RecU n=1 Tax=Halalkalibacterium ligniniphilum TaxID=1134413 RepID=UPI00047717A8|nr:Holliday junction resolvase RecU [Halalkalibacterium ligniniphilum]
MTIRYPNGKRYNTQAATKKPCNKKLSHSNRGMTLETDINETNDYYLSQRIAVIHKKPTPVQIVHVDYPMRSAAVIKEAYFKQPSTTDYNGVYRGRYLDFEAKETRNKTSFPLQNFHEHQITHMKNVLDQQGICFVLLKFTVHDEIYLLDAHYVIREFEAQHAKRKSIQKSDIETNGFLIKIGYHPRVDYLSIVDKVYFK